MSVESLKTSHQPQFLCRVEDIPEGLGRKFLINHQEIAVFRTRQNKIFVLANRCPHRQGELSEGMLADDQVVCPMHAARFYLATGACDSAILCGNDVKVKSFPVVIESGKVYLLDCQPI